MKQNCTCMGRCRKWMAETVPICDLVESRTSVSVCLNSDIFAVTESTGMESADSWSPWKMFFLWPNIQVKFIFHIQNPGSINFIFRCAQLTLSTHSNAFWSPHRKGMNPLGLICSSNTVWSQGEAWRYRHTPACPGMLGCGELGLCLNPFKIHRLHSNPQYLRMSNYLKIGHLKR